MSSASESPLARELRIKTGVVRRLQKELAMYHNEVEQQKARISRMEQEGADSHDVNKQREVLEESDNMIPDCEARLKSAYEDLVSFLDSNGDSEELAGNETLDEAKKRVAELEDQLEDQ